MSFDLKTARVNAGHSVRSLAVEIGVHRATIEKLEDGGVVYPANAKKVADFFEVKVTDLMPLERPEAAA